MLYAGLFKYVNITATSIALVLDLFKLNWKKLRMADFPFYVAINSHLLLIVCFLWFRAGDSVKAAGDNVTYSATNITYNLNTTVLPVLNSTVKVSNSSLIPECSVRPTHQSTRGKLHLLLVEGAKIVEFDLQFNNHSGKFPREDNSDVYRLQHWVRTTGRHGRGLLMLEHNYDIMSIFSLTIGVEKMEVELEESPPGCLTSRPVSEIEGHLRELILADFHLPDNPHERGSLGTNEHICNTHIRNNKGRAEFVDMCCNKSPEGDTVCSFLEEDFWLSVLFRCIYILKIIVLLISPLLVPASYYSIHYIAVTYVHSVQAPIKLNVVLTRAPQSYETEKATSLSKFANMTLFKETIKKLKPDIKYTMSLSKIHLRVKSRRILSEKHKPVGIFRSLYETLIRCKIREKESIRECCNSNICGPLRPVHRAYPWYRCLQEMMRAVVLGLFAVPWILRVAIYFAYEEAEVISQRRAAELRGLQSPFPGNLTMYLTPIHALFIIIYLVIIIDSIAFGVLRKRMKEKFKYVLRHCFRDMREKSRVGILGWAAKTFLKPLQKFGFIGLLIGIPYWLIAVPVIACVTGFYWLPTPNLTLRLLAHFVIYLIPENGKCGDNRIFERIRTFAMDARDNFNLKIIAESERVEKGETQTRESRVIQLLVIAMCLISMYSILLLLMECVSFFVEIAVYTMMGVILNAGNTMQFVTLFLLLLIYGNDCLSSVSKKYIAFNSKIQAELKKRAGDDLKKTALLTKDLQGNTVFQIKPDFYQDDGAKPIATLTESAEGIPKWETNGFLLFLDWQDTPYIPRTFFFESCYLPHFGCPGKLYLNFIRAMGQFALILFFLLFVLIVVLAFGDMYQISSTNKMLATLAGGLLPWMLRNILFKSPPGLELDTSNLSFQNHFNHAIEAFQQRWPLGDIEVDDVTVSSSTSYPPAYIQDYDEAPDVTRLSEASFNDIRPSMESTPKPKSQLQVPTKDSIDLLINIAKADKDSFPGMFRGGVPQAGSMSMLADIDDSWRSTQPIIRNVSDMGTIVEI